MKISNILIRQATKIDEDKIEVFLKKAYKNSAQYKYPKRWNWLFKKNPYVTNNDKLPVWIALHDKTVVGMSCAMLVELELKRKIFKAGGQVGNNIFASEEKKYHKKGEYDEQINTFQNNPADRDGPKCHRPDCTRGSFIESREGHVCYGQGNRGGRSA